MRIGFFSAVSALALLLVSSPALADFRVFEENAPTPPRAETPEEPEEAPPPAPPPTPPPPAPRIRIEQRCTACAGATCDAEPPVCTEGQSPSVVDDGCWGACVPTDQCGVCEDVEVQLPPEPALVTEPEPVEASEPDHTEPAEVEPPPAEPQGDHRWLDITGFLQPGYIWRQEGGEPVARSPVDDAFLLQRARLGLRSQLFWWFRARLEVELVPSPTLQDGFLDITLHPAVSVRVGQFIVPFLRAFSFNELNLSFLDRPLYTPLGQDRTVIRYLAPRDIGVMVSGLVGNTDPSATDPVFEYNLAAMVGRGPNVATNADGVFLWSLRLQLHILGLPGPAVESDLQRSAAPRVSVGTGAYSNCDDRGSWNRGFTFDAEFRFQGVYASGAFVWFRNGRADPDGFGGLLAGSDIGSGTVASTCAGAVRIPDPGSPTGERNVDYVARGAHFQIQYAIPHIDVDIVRDMEFEILARIDWVDPFAPYSDSDPLFGTDADVAAQFRPSDYIDSDNGFERWRLTFGLNWFPTGDQSIRLGLNYFLQYESENVVTAVGEIAGIQNDIFWAQITAGL